MKRVSKRAHGAKTHFMLIDAVGEEKRAEERKPCAGREARRRASPVAESIAVSVTDGDTVLSLGNRLVRLAKQFDARVWTRIKQTSGGTTLNELVGKLVSALDPDLIVANALHAVRLPHHSQRVRGVWRRCCEPLSQPSLILLALTPRPQ